MQNESIYRVGDKVIIRKAEDMLKEYGNLMSVPHAFTEAMQNYCGLELRLISGNSFGFRCGSNRLQLYPPKQLDVGYTFGPEMFEPKQIDLCKMNGYISREIKFKYEHGKT